MKLRLILMLFILFIWIATVNARAWWWTATIETSSSSNATRSNTTRSKAVESTSTNNTYKSSNYTKQSSSSNSYSKSTTKTKPSESYSSRDYEWYTPIITTVHVYHNDWIWLLDMFDFTWSTSEEPIRYDTTMTDSQYEWVLIIWAIATFIIVISIWAHLSFNFPENLWF